MNQSIQEIFEELVQLGECQSVEVKKCAEEKIGHSIMQTICAFANEPGLGGGWLLLGISEPDSAHDTFWVSGVQDVDKCLRDLQTNCRLQFQPTVVSIKAVSEKIDGKSVIGVFVCELDASDKPCRFDGKFDRTNKKKTGVWRRGANGDYECTEKELEPILMAKIGIRYEQTVPFDINMDDLDSSAIELYRNLRAQMRSNPEELQFDHLGLLNALSMVKKQDHGYVPNVAGLLMFGKSSSLRRLLPAVRVDYVRIAGNMWVENPDQRFQYTLDLREPLIRLITKLETTILDDMPYHFRLEEGDMQRSDQPLLPQRVVREAIVNAVMHRDYNVHQPTTVVRYRNRLEIHNAGYSLKPTEEFHQAASTLRNPALAAVLYDLGFAETKGSGIRTMQRLLDDAGLSKPIFESDQSRNHFVATFLLHQLLDEEQLQWLQQFKHLNLSNDEAKALVLIKERGAIDNAALRSITNLNTLSASQLFKRLWQQHGLLEKGGNGRATYYKLTAQLIADLPATIDVVNRETYPAVAEGEFMENRSDLGSNRSDLGSDRSDLGSDRSDFPSELQAAINDLTPKARESQLRPIILKICMQRAYSAERLAFILKRDVTSLKNKHLVPMREDGLIGYMHPDVVNHPEQAYIATEKGKQWLLDLDNAP